MKNLIVALSSIPGVVGVGLGGSRGLGIADNNSDYDFILFRNGGDHIHVDKIVDAINKHKESSADSHKIEVFETDLHQVAKEIEFAKQGKFIWSTKQLFPHGDLSTNQISHIMYLYLCAERDNSVTRLRQLAEPFPEKLKHGLIKFFLSQAKITLIHASKIRRKEDLQYLVSLCSSFVFFTNIVLFALNNRYPVTEKGGASLAFRLPLTIHNYQQRIPLLFTNTCSGNYGLVVTELAAMFDELKSLTEKTSLDSLPN